MSEFSVSLAKLAEEANLTIAYTPCELEKIQVTATEVYARASCWPVTMKISTASASRSSA